MESNGGNVVANVNGIDETSHPRPSLVTIAMYMVIHTVTHIYIHESVPVRL